MCHRVLINQPEFACVFHPDTRSHDFKHDFFAGDIDTRWTVFLDESAFIVNEVKFGLVDLDGGRAASDERIGPTDGFEIGDEVWFVAIGNVVGLEEALV